ncbi:hypothetical protein [Fusobacterium sp.]|uniref:hypothetical protein n=1 Tax=Fusobacterium sp. TaxID=68766 RepID=UPI002636103F|nr:hypothetical protein [Fusobacterium sp.]
MTTQNKLLLKNLNVIHVDENFGAALSDSEKKSILERYIQFSFDEIEVSQLCKYLGVWFPNITDRKVNQINFFEYIERGKKYLEVVLNYNDYTFFSETIKHEDDVIEKIKNIIK